MKEESDSVLFYLGTFNVQCHECIVKNTFHCPVKRTCPYHIRRCFTVSMRKYQITFLLLNESPHQCSFKGTAPLFSLSVPTLRPCFYVEAQRPIKGQAVIASCRDT